jgi:eight-cysteine-cluster-containing protein
VSDADCDPLSWCRPTESDDSECVPYQKSGESCGGFTLPWMQEKCPPELECEDQTPLLADDPGICVEPSANDDCVVSGCSSEVCADEEMISTCIWKPWYDCLVLTTCGNNGEAGACGWEQNADYTACVDEAEEPVGCSTAGVTCMMAPPVCPEGLTPVELNDCWGCGYPDTCSCSDGSPNVCDMVPPTCAEGTILAEQGGCFVCVDPMTCAPPK